MANFIVDLYARFKDKPFVLWMPFLWFAALFAASIRFSWEDYISSVYGIQQLPGNWSADDLPYFLALLPQGIQVTMAFVATTRRNNLAWLITGVALLFDTLTDMAFKMQGVEPTAGNTLTVLFISFLAFTVGSEVLLIYSSQNLLHTARPALRMIAPFVRKALRFLWYDTILVFLRGTGDDLAGLVGDRREDTEPQRPPASAARSNGNRARVVENDDLLAGRGR